MNLDIVSGWFQALGVHPVLGSFFSGALLTLIGTSFNGNFRKARSTVLTPSAHAAAPSDRGCSDARLEGSIIVCEIGGKQVEISPSQSSLIIDMIRTRQKIEAVKSLRMSGLGLAEAKKCVEALEKYFPAR